MEKSRALFLLHPQAVSKAQSLWILPCLGPARSRGLEEEQKLWGAKTFLIGTSNELPRGGTAKGWMMDDGWMMDG